MPIEIARPPEQQRNGEDDVAREITAQIIKASRISARAEAVIEEWDEWIYRIHPDPDEEVSQDIIALAHAIERLRGELRS